jgi:hypothetical protein
VSAATGRSSGYQSRGSAGDSDAELGADVPHDLLDRRRRRNPGRRSGCGTSSMPSSAGIHASGQHPLADSLQPAEITQPPDLRRWHKARPDQPVRNEQADPLRVLDVGLAAGPNRSCRGSCCTIAVSRPDVPVSVI